ncbi:MAG: FAD binding domain-containing protein [Candidatus Omnitrophota bacterium]
MGLLKDFKYYTPATLKEALGLLKNARYPLVLGGGTLSLNHLKKAAKYPSDVVGLKKVSVLRGIKDLKGAVAIGTMTTIAEICASGIIRKNFPSLVEACSKSATTPIRNMATIGGNVASRFFWVDLPAVLISLGAKVSIATAGRQRVVSIQEFLGSKPPKKFILTKVVIPKSDCLSFYFRHTKTMVVDVPSLALAFFASLKKGKLSGVVLVVNTTVSFPVKLKEVAAAMEDRHPKEVSLKSVTQALNKDVEKLRLDEYRVGCLATDLESLLGIFSAVI